MMFNNASDYHINYLKCLFRKMNLPLYGPGSANELWGGGQSSVEDIFADLSHIFNQSAFDDCEPCSEKHRPEETQGRIILTSFCGTGIAVLSALSNVFVLCVLMLHSKYRDSHFVYLIFLALFDIVVAVTYIPLIAGYIVAWHYESVLLISYWSSYAVPCLVLSHVSMTSSSYLIITATFERYLVTTRSSFLSFVRNRRFVWCLLCVSIAMVSKCGIVLELMIDHKPFCEDRMGAYRVVATKFIQQNELYDLLYKFWFRNVTGVFAPFTMLMYLNTQIVRTLHKQRKTARLFQFTATVHTARIRSATKMLVSITCTYLVANILSVVLTLWEHIDQTSLNAQTVFYAYAVDFSSFLTILASLLRLPIYVVCNDEFRHDAHDAIMLRSCLKKQANDGGCTSNNQSLAFENGTGVTAVGYRRRESNEKACMLTSRASEKQSVVSYGTDSMFGSVKCSNYDRLALAIAVRRPSELLHIEEVTRC